MRGEKEDDLISRQAAIDEISRWLGYLNDDMILRIQIGLRRLPSAQPERKKGYWKHVNEEEERAKHNGQLLGWMPWYCSECECGVGKHKTTFCPNCGADMRGE